MLDDLLNFEDKADYSHVVRSGKKRLGKQDRKLSKQLRNKRQNKRH